MGQNLSWLHETGASGVLTVIQLTNAALTDFALHKRTLSATTRTHLRDTIAFLNKKLSEGDGYASESAILIVMTLAMMAVLWGDWEAVRMHVGGLGRIVGLRGGEEYLRRCPKYHFKMIRYEFALLHSTSPSSPSP